MPLLLSLCDGRAVLKNTASIERLNVTRLQLTLPRGSTTSSINCDRCGRQNIQMSGGLQRFQAKRESLTCDEVSVLVGKTSSPPVLQPSNHQPFQTSILPPLQPHSRPPVCQLLTFYYPGGGHGLYAGFQKRDKKNPDLNPHS
ncbi:uncharacterized protein LOC144984429 [Oryzias latipes]